MRNFLLFAAAGALTAVIALILVPAARNILPANVDPANALYLVLLLAFLLVARTHRFQANFGQSVFYIAAWVGIIAAFALVLHMFGV